MLHDHNSLSTVFIRSLIFKKATCSKTENMKAKDPIWIFFYITEDHEDDFKKTTICKYGAKCCVFLSVLKVRD